ncbi:hypothetical protein PN36_33670 [Candidatus Thiomargarita nelsonii]|uniref:Uncharacterized protein n=1 Tax=Candidatus Thiomargarita nelsonii TaxID=1003181 RepID=A0A4E0QR92_9GAMM|nr:hypothetical protein PN36_33670 [Candidatus Thiomargarita nelsonii]
MQSQQSFSLDEKNVLKFNENWDHNTLLCKNVNSPSTGQTELQHELEKAQLMVEQRDKEIDYLKQQVSDLREMNNLLKQSAKPKE